jgi:hypothetical protein
MTASYCTAISVFLIAIGMLANTAAANDPPGKMELLPGYKHEPLQGIDSIVGKVSNPMGLSIQYEIGRVRKPGEFGLGGDFTDQAKAVPEADRRWYREHRIGGQSVHIALSKENSLSVSYPDTGVNFHVTVKSSEDLTDALLMILSYPGAAK